MASSSRPGSARAETAGAKAAADAGADVVLVEANAEFAHGVAEYEQFGLFEDMAADAEAAAERRACKQPKPSPAAAPEGKVLSIARANGDG